MKIPEIEWNSRNGDDILAWAIEFEEDIAGVNFRFESTMSNGFGKVSMSVDENDANGMIIIANKYLVFEKYKEQRPAGDHIGYLKVIDGDGERTIFKYIIKVEPKKL